MKPVKIFELKMKDWYQGLSLQSSIAISGIFSSSTNFDPFEVTGIMQPSLGSTIASDLSLTFTPTVLTPFSVSGSPKILVHTPTKLYQVLDGTPWTTTDKTSSVVVTNGVRGALIYQGRYIYTLDTQTRSNSLALNDDKQILNGMASDGIWHPLCVGADKNLYVGDFSTINLITNANGTSGNVTQKINLEAGMYVRDLVNDGRYLVIFADNNPTGDYNTTGSSPTPPTPIAGKYRCQVLFWDMVSPSFEQIFEFSDSNIVGAEILEGTIYIWGGDNLYICNLATSPKTIFSFRSPSTITEKPQTPYQILQAKNSIYWCGQSNGSIYAYGSLFPGMKKIFYQPFNAIYTPSAITYNGSKFYTGTSGTDNFLQVSDTGSLRNTGSITTAPLILSRPYKFSYAKVVMQQALASGNSVVLGMTSNAGNKTITDNVTKNFSTLGAKQTILFDKIPGAVDIDYFEDFQLVIASGKAIERVEIWGIPQDDYSQSI